jgi:hypothetical protein
MSEMDLLARMRDNAPRRVSPHAEQLFRAALCDHRDQERARPAERLRRLAPGGVAGGRAPRPAWRRLAVAALPALAGAAALLLVMLPSAGGPRPGAERGAAPLTVKLLADRAAAAALTGPAIAPGQWVYEKLAVSSRAQQISAQELWVTADDRAQAGYVNGRLYKEYRDQNETMPAGGLPVMIGSFTVEPLAYSALGSLPSEPRALINRLGKLGAELPGPVLGCKERAAYCDAFQMITQLFSGYVMPPKAAAKLFTAIGDIPGVSVTPDVPGPDGQRGVAFRLQLKTGYQQLVLNPVTYKPTGGPWYSSIVQQELVPGPGVRP